MVAVPPSWTTVQPMRSSSSPIHVTSAMRGTLWSTDRPGANRAAAMSLSAEFLAPDTRTVPSRGPDRRTRIAAASGTGFTPSVCCATHQTGREPPSPGPRTTWWLTTPAWRSCARPATTWSASGPTATTASYSTTAPSSVMSAPSSWRRLPKAGTGSPSRSPISWPYRSGRCCSPSRCASACTTGAPRGGRPPTGSTPGPHASWPCWPASRSSTAIWARSSARPSPSPPTSSTGATPPRA